MIRTTMILSGAALLVGAFCFGADEETIIKQRVEKTNDEPAVTSGEQPNPRPAQESPAKQPVSAPPSADEEAIRLADQSFAKAYGRGDAKEIAALFTADAEFVDEWGNIFQGREDIEQAMAAFFAENPDCKLEMNINTIRFISPGVAVEDGSTTMTCITSPTPVESRYTTVYVKTDGKWLAASVRDHAPKARREHRLQLKQLEWLQGDWVDEGDDSLVNFSCRLADNGKFLLRTFTIHTAGQVVMSGTQRIGWDPQTGKLRSWIFDSEGGYAEGLWYQDGENWVLKCTGVTADGQSASGTSIYTFVNEYTMTWQSVNYEIAGVKQPDSEIITIVRQAPPPITVITAEPK